MTLIKEKSGLLGMIEERFNSFESKLNGDASSEFHANRRKAFNLLRTQDFPGRKNEEYKYTPITKILEKEFAESAVSESKLISQLQGPLAARSDIHLIIFRNGRLDESTLLSSQQKGFTLSPLSEASSNSNFEKNFNKAFPENTDSFALLNTSFSKEGLFLHVAKNSIVEKPIIVLHLNESKGSGSISNPRNLLVFEEGSETTFIECFENSDGQAVFSNSLSEFIVKKNAKINYSKFGFDSGNSIRVSSANVYQENDSRFTSTTIDFGGKTIRNNLNIIVDGKGCESNMFGLYLLNGNSHVDNHTMIDHKQPNCESNELYKGILGGSSRGVFNGKIYVRQDAQKTNAFQQNNNILMSEEAIINTKPQLEIWADDVKCSHGCTSGQIDEEQIFYLRSRGIDTVSARKMLLQAYASEVLDSIKLDVLKDHTENIIAQMLEDM